MFATIQFIICQLVPLSKNVEIKIYRTVIYPLFCMAVTLKEEYILRMLTSKSGPKREEVAGGWRRLQNK
jgi:hypothetical protein